MTYVTTSQRPSEAVADSSHNTVSTDYYNIYANNDRNNRKIIHN